MIRRQMLFPNRHSGLRKERFSLSNMSYMKKEISFAEFYEKESPLPFYVLLGLFVFSNMLLVINYTEPFGQWAGTVRLYINAAVLALSSMYAAFNIVLWKLKPETCFAALAIILFTSIGWNYIGRTHEYFSTVLAAVLALLSYGRNYRTILKIVMGCHIFTMLAGAAGLLIGYSAPVHKIDSTDIGLSLGLIYPNHVGRMTFLVFMIVWYLRGQKKRMLTAGVSFLLAVIMWFVIKCKTISIFFVLFPLFWEIMFRLREKRETLLRKLCAAVLVPIPFLCMAATWVLAKNRVFFLKHWHYGQGIYALWMRFISAGALFKKYGFTLFGRNLREEKPIVEMIEGYYYKTYIVDNAYVFYLVSIGGIALMIIMLWFCFANFRALKNRDYAFLLMNFFMCGYGMIEIVLFRFEHNFLFFYPLTAAAMMYRKAGRAEEPAAGLHFPFQHGTINNRQEEQNPLDQDFRD